MKTLTALFWALIDLLDPERARRMEIHKHRSEGAKKGWAKRKAKEVPHDIQ